MEGSEGKFMFLNDINILTTFYLFNYSWVFLFYTKDDCT